MVRNVVVTGVRNKVVNHLEISKMTNKKAEDKCNPFSMVAVYYLNKKTDQQLINRLTILELNTFQVCMVTSS
ncbi:hypothetical protein SAMN04488109_1808 [Chryseolinea serpens]|uniref:Uncharacterized protein n=1 Tax=Chryseolinea serpens TaxID=947013 RepID=A0A1M5ML78_9BACT|nr:hypothetical protein SAMN04488109_1808 [Chryseolinea serpens]